MDWMTLLGAAAFGSVVGWSASLAISKEERFGIAQLGALISVIGGAAVTALFQVPKLFAGYCMGLAVAFFIHRFVNIPSVRRGIDRSINAQQ